MMKSLRILILVILPFTLFSQKPESGGAGEVVQKLKKLSVLGTVLYVAAHPDDENTQLIAYMANGELMRTGYLSATRGDGGQNLVGSEIRESLGVIRTQELLAARETDGGVQFFSRANDFGYSKDPEETLTIWDRDQVLSDFVRVIRTFKPDVIITRFNLKPGITHGHHTTSAILAKEAFHLAGDSTAYPEQLAEVEVWQPSKLFWNTSWWFYRNSGEKMDTSKFITVNVGQYNPNLGRSYTEIAAESRSMHKSQGFGATGSRGNDIEYLEQWAGEDTGDVFGGIETSWSRVDGGEVIAKYVSKALEVYDPADPENTLSNLFKAREELLKLSDQFWKEEKIREIEDLVQIITGTYLEVVADDYSYVPGDSIQLSLEAISRLGSYFTLESVTFNPWGARNELNYELRENEKLSSDFTFVVPEDLPFSHPYWLNEKATLGMYHVPAARMIGKPENDPVFAVRFTLKWEDQYLEFERPVVFKLNDPVKGEVYRPVEITPPAMINMGSSVLIFSDDEPKAVKARVIAGEDNIKGQLSLKMPEEWIVSPASYDFLLDVKNEEKVFSFTITPPASATVSFLKPKITLSSHQVYNRGRQVISYDHIPVQTLFPQSEVRIVKIDVKKYGERIGYIEGAGDEIPKNLQQIGYKVDFLQKDDVTLDKLKKYDAVVLGIRAYNTVAWLSYKNQVLFDYVRGGGTLLTQYNTSYRMITDEVSPLPLKLSRDRVTSERAKVKFLAPEHPVLNEPNKITQEDFSGWVQERGLYFPEEWSEEFTPILSSNDPGEEPLEGGLLVAPVGKGYFIYSGYSWFRQLPAGVPGAFRIMANILSLGNSGSNP